MFYDPAVVAAKVDLVRVMKYDMYYGPGADTIGGGWVDGGAGTNRTWPSGNRPDCGGIGPTSTQPWARAAMTFWAKYVPLDKLVMGLPSYANDYKIAPGQVGSAAGLALPDNATQVEYFWDFFNGIFWIRYHLLGAILSC